VPEEQQPHGGRHKPSRMSDGIRKSVSSPLDSSSRLEDRFRLSNSSRQISKHIQRVTDRVRTRLEGIEIERRVEIVQETKQGQVDHAADASYGMDTFVGPSTAGLAHISTQVSSGHGRIGFKHFHLPRFGGSKR
jgi:hypothetical protein